MTALRPLRMLVVAVWLAGCSVGAQDEAVVRSEGDVPFGLLEPDAPPLLTTPAAADSNTDPVRLCFLDGDRVVGIETTIKRPVGLDDVIDALAEAPNADRTLRSAVGDPAIVDAVELVAGVAQVDLQPSLSELGSDDQLLAVAQLVCSLTGRPGVGLVSFTLEGQPAEVPTGDGALTSNPVSRDDYAQLLD